MEQLSLYRSIGFNHPAVVSFYGAGGKSSLIHKLAHEIAAAGGKALLTTTTRIYRPAGLPLICEPALDLAVEKLLEHFASGDLAVLGKSILPDGKVAGIDPEQVAYLREQLQVPVLVEADGAKGRSLKGYAHYEPVIPPASDWIIPVLGGDALGKKISSANTHRVDYFTTATGTREDDVVTEEIIARSFCFMLDAALAQAPRAQSCLVINKVDLLANPGAVALKVASLLKNNFKSYSPGKLLVTEALQPGPVKITLNLSSTGSPVTVACIILAAGKSTRMGLDKVFLRARGKTILERTMEEAAASGLNQLIIVTTPGMKNLPSTMKADQALDLAIKMIENRDYRKGMSTSLKAGLQTVNPDTQGVLFALGDQPHVSARVYKKIREEFSHNLPLVTCPVYKGSRGNPVLFDRRTWSKLMDQSGDRGGRDVINNLKPEQVDFVEVETPAVLWDIDSPDDYLAYLDFLNNP